MNDIVVTVLLITALFAILASQFFACVSKERCFTPKYLDVRRVIENPDFPSAWAFALPTRMIDVAYRESLGLSLRSMTLRIESGRDGRDRIE